MPRMRRQHRFVARGRSRRLPRRMIAGSFLPGLACLALVAFLSPALASAAREPSPAPNALLEAFPLNPTGERIVSPTYARPGTFRPPVQPAALARSPDTDLVFLAAIGGVGVVALLALVGLASVLLRWSSSNRSVTTGGQERPSAYISAVFMGTRRLPVIEGGSCRKPGVVRTKESVRVLVGCAVAVVVALLVFQYVG